MNELKIFESQEFGSVRTAIIDGEPWFVGKDVCTLFGDKNHNRSLGRLDEVDRTTVEFNTAGGKQQVVVVNESGLYALLFAMQPQKAHSEGVSDEYPLEVQQRIDKLHAFKRWITHEVIPSIRKHGMYAKEELLDNPDLLLEVVTKLKAERDARIALEKENQQLAPKAEYTDKVLKPGSLLTATTIAKDFGMSAYKFNRLLERLGVQYKQGGHWHLKEKYNGLGYTDYTTYLYDEDENKTDTAMRWTQKGRAFLYNLLQECDITPQEPFQETCA